MARHTNLPQKKYAKIKRGVERDYFGRKYVFRKSIPYEAASQIFYQKKAWQMVGGGTKIVDLFPGFEVDYTTSRQYPWESLLVHVLGTVGPISENEYRLREKDYRLTDKVGRRGLEFVWEEKLRGRRGCYVDNREGYRFTEYPTDGYDLVLTVDARLQQIAEQSLDRAIAQISNATGGAAVVMDVTSGDILVLATSPRYDNRSLAQNYETLTQDPRRPLENRTIKNYFPTPPGSVFKVMVAAYALEKGIIDEHTRFECQGYLHKPSEFRCTHVHRTVSIVEAISGSCNVYFYHVGEMLGGDMLSECASLFGYGEKSNLGLPEEYAGYIPPPSPSWPTGQCRMFGIGQILTATPVQVACAMAMIANHGTMPAPRLVKDALLPNIASTPRKDPDSLPNDSSDDAVALMADAEPPLTPRKPEIRRDWPIQQKNWLFIREGMRRVTEGMEGTANDMQKRLGNIRIASKTGTSQVQGEDHAWFAGFAPLDSPQYAFAVFIEHGGYGGRAAAPVAVEIIKALSSGR
jgi:penicillin-binding protein 2